MGKLQLAFLGAPEVHHEGQGITFATRKTLALLVYLTVEGGVQPRDHLTALLWPESDAIRGRASLRKSLGYLHQVLAHISPENSHIVAARNTLQLAADASVEVDVWQLRAATQTLRQPPLASPEAIAALPSAYRLSLLQPLQQVISRYRGDFLTGFSLSDAPSFDEWASQQRELWHQQAILLFDRLSQVQFEAGELSDTLETTARWLTQDRLNEAPYRRLMQLHLANGDRNAAWQTYIVCQTMLDQELGVAPAPETEVLAQRIKSAGGRIPTVPSRPLAPDPLRPRSLPLVGRAFEHGQLVNSYRQAQAGQVQVVILEGEAGIGKTRLAEEFLGWASAQGANIWRGRALEGSAHLPYQPIVAALRPLLNHPDLTALSPIWLAELGRLLPELAESRPDLPSPGATNTPESHLRLLEAISRLGQTIASNSMVLVFMDDLQWADAASLELLAYVAQRWLETQPSALFLFTLRQEELLHRPALSDWLSGLRRILPVTRLTLSALSLEDTQRLVQTVSGAETSHALPPNLLLFAQQLHQETKGQPFFLVQLLRSLLERKLLQQDEQGVWQAHLDRQLPGTVRELLQSRLARLSTPGQTCCGVGAVLGDGFTFATMYQIAGLPEREAISALEELLERGILRELLSDNAATSPVIFFTHDYIREVAYQHLSETRRRLLHQAALDALTTTASPGQLARHALRAGLLEPAFRYSVSAGMAALQVFAIRDALHHFSQAHHLWQTSIINEQNDLSDLAFSLYQQFGRAYELNGQTREAVEQFTILLHLSHARGDLVQEGIALNRLATTQAHALVSLDEPLALLQKALQVAAASGHKSLLSETEWNLALLNYYLAQIPTALAYAQHGLSLARESGPTELVARLLNTLAYLYWEVGHWNECLACGEESQVLFAQAGNQAMQVDSLVQIAQAYLALGQRRQALQVAQTALGIAMDIRTPWGEVISHFQMAIILMEGNELEEALYEAETAVTIAKVHDLKLILCVAHLILGHVYRMRGELERAWDVHLQAYGFNEAIPSKPFKAPAAAALCADAVFQGNWDKAYTWANRALAARPTSLQFHADMTFWCEIAALLHNGEGERASQVLKDAQDRFRHRSRYQIAYYRALALLADWSGDIAAADTYWQATFSLATEMDLPGEIHTQWSTSGYR